PFLDVAIAFRGFKARHMELSCGKTPTMKSKLESKDKRTAREAFGTPAMSRDGKLSTAKSVLINTESKEEEEEEECLACVNSTTMTTASTSSSSSSLTDGSSSSILNYSSPGRIDGKVIFAPRSSGDREERLRLYQRMKSDVTSDCKKHLHFGQKKKKKKSNMKEDENNELEKDREQHSMASDFILRLSLSLSLSPSFCSSHHHDKDKADRQTPKHDRFSSACKKKQNKNKKWTNVLQLTIVLSDPRH
ncbi:hypothetical protein RFI_05539, partial [Reticulomyxa filosa]